jgi:predicted dienelactone hydrolase
MLKVTLLSFCIILVSASYSQSVKLVPNNPIAKIAGRMHGEEEDYAITIGRTIYLSCSKEDFLSDTPWVRHEFTHVQQYKKYGILEFTKRYLFFAIFFHSYSKNPFEKEAISAEGKKTNYKKPSITMSSY